MRFYSFVFLPERMRTACDRSGANGNGASPKGTRRTDNARGQLETMRFLFWTEDVAAQSERRASLLAFPRCSNVTERKHYYAGTDLCASREQSQACLSYAETKQSVRSNRVAARLGGGGLNALQPVIGNDVELQKKADRLFKQCLEQVNHRVLGENDLKCIMNNEFARDEFGKRIDGIPYQVRSAVKVDNWQFKEMVNSMLVDLNNGQEKEVFFYHSDHLGSASWITNRAGDAIQHLQYLPYGESYVNQRISGYSERFTFNGKEKDHESGFHYYGARYYWSEVLTGWLSVDPMADKYPSISPYAYCAWNPIKYVDPDGMKFDSVSQIEVNKLKKQATLNWFKWNKGDIKSNLYQREYNATLNEILFLEESDQKYYVRNHGRNIRMEGIKGGASGRTIYKKETDKVMIVYNGNLGPLAHELKHAYQFETGNISFDATGYSGGILDDFYDEREAHNRGAAFGSPVRTDEFIKKNYNLPCTNTTVNSMHSNGESIVGSLIKWGDIYRTKGVTYKAGLKVSFN